jgi:hypothetical protein
VQERKEITEIMEMRETQDKLDVLDHTTTSSVLAFSMAKNGGKK